MDTKLKIKKDIWPYLLVFFFSCAVKCISLLGCFNMKFVSDNIGVLVIPSLLTGSDWSGLIQNGLVYYGWGYYILLAPLFYFTNDPYEIYYTICFVNIILIGGIGVLIYHILVKYLCTENSKFNMVAIAVLCTNFANVSSTNFTSEAPAFLIVWLSAYWLVKCHSANKNEQVLYTICLILTLTWGATIHTRLLILWLAIGCGVIIIWLLLKKWIVNPLTFLISSMLGILIEEGLKKYIISTVWNVSNAGELRNAALLDWNKVVNSSVTLKVIIDIIISNLYKISMETYGLFPISLVIILVCFWCLLRKRWKREIIDLNESEIIAIIFMSIFGLALIGTIGGIPINFGQGIATGYAQGIENERFSGLTYIRYYFIYFGPIFVAAYEILKQKLYLFSSKLRTSIIGIIILSLYIWLFVFPHINSYYGNYIYNNFVSNDTFRSNFVITVVLLTIGLFLYNILIKTGKTNIVIYIVLCLTVLSGWDFSKSEFFVLFGPSRGGEGIYEIWHEAEDEVALPSTVYVSSNCNALASVQFMLSDIPVKSGLPTQDIEEAVFYTNLKDDETKKLLSQGYKLYHIGVQEYLWIKGERLQTSLEPYIVSYVTTNKHIYSDEFTYETGILKIGNVITGLKDNCRAEYKINGPVDGSYEYSISLNSLYTKNQEIGSFEIWLDDKLVTKYVLTEDILNENEKIEGGFSVSQAENIIFVLYVKEGSIVNDFNVEYRCIDIQKQFGMNRDTELMNLLEAMQVIDLNLPIYIAAEGNIYNTNTDFSYVESCFKKEISGTVDALEISRFNKNCYVILENDSNNRLIFDLVEKYKIISRTDHYTLLLYDNNRNNKVLEDAGISGFSGAGKIDVNYFRYSEGMLANEVTNILDKGLYRVEINNEQSDSDFQNIFLDVINTQSIRIGTDENNLSASFWSNGDTTRFNLVECYSFHSDDFKAYVSKISSVYKVGDRMEFSDSTQCFSATNLYGIEDWGQWSAASENQIIFPVSDESDLTLDMQVRSIQEQEVTIYANGKLIGSYYVNMSPTVITMNIPKEYLEGEYLTLTVLTENTWLVNDIIGNGDLRNVGLGYFYIEIKSPEEE